MGGRAVCGEGKVVQVERKVVGSVYRKVVTTWIVFD